MLLTSDNYFNYQAGLEYQSASQLKSFMDCEMAAFAALHEAYQRPMTTALLVGSYVDAYYSRQLEQFSEKHPEIYKRDGQLKAEYLQAEAIIDRINESSLVRHMLDGVSQIIYSGEIDGLPFKGKFDSLLSADQCAAICELWPAMQDQLLMADGAIVDLKVMRDLNSVYKPGQGRVNFIEAWRYDLQLAIYQRIEGHRLPCFIVAATKEETPDLRLIHVPNYQLDAAWEAAKPTALRVEQIKMGKVKPERCEKCNYCRSTRIIEEAIDFEDLEGVGV
jgi:hypothetical protein